MFDPRTVIAGRCATESVRSGVVSAEACGAYFCLGRLRPPRKNILDASSRIVCAVMNTFSISIFRASNSLRGGSTLRSNGGHDRHKMGHRQSFPAKVLAVL